MNLVMVMYIYIYTYTKPIMVKHVYSWLMAHHRGGLVLDYVVCSLVMVQLEIEEEMDQFLVETD